jgi:aminopeptidase
MVDPRIEEYARLLVEECVDVQPGWQVVVIGQPLGRPLIEEVVRQVARRGAYSILRLGWHLGADLTWVKDAPEELVAKPAPAEWHLWDTIDTYIGVVAPENTRDGSNVPPERIAAFSQAYRPVFEPYFAKEKPWVGCQYPTPALAQDAGMTLHEFEEFLYGAVLVDWNALREQMRRIADRFDAGSEVRIVGEGTDLRFSLEARLGEVDALGANLPGGEIFYSPVEDSAEGEITFSEYPACYLGRQVPGVHFRFEGGRIVEADAAGDVDFLLSTLDSDEGARRLGEFGIGCNPGIQKHMRNTLFDEKIEGTVHLAVGQGFPFLGGTNKSAIHWDIVKDLRRGGRIELDGELVQENGEWKL